MRAPEWLWGANTLGPYARMVYAHLLVYRSATDSEVYPGQARICEALGISESSIRRGLRELEAAGLVVSHRQWNDDVTRRQNTYIVHAPRELPDNLRPVTQTASVTQTGRTGHTDRSDRSQGPHNPVQRTSIQRTSLGVTDVSTEAGDVAEVVQEKRAQERATHTGDVIEFPPSQNRREQKPDSFRWGVARSLGRAEWDIYVPEFVRVHGREPYVSEYTSWPSASFFDDVMAELRAKPTKASGREDKPSRPRPDWDAYTMTDSHWAVVDEEWSKVFGTPPRRDMWGQNPRPAEVIRQVRRQQRLRSTPRNNVDSNDDEDEYDDGQCYDMDGEPMDCPSWAVTA